MLADHLEPADVAMMDAALSAEVRDRRIEAPESAPPAAECFGAARGAGAGVLLGAVLWAVILISVLKT